MRDAHTPGNVPSSLAARIGLGLGPAWLLLTLVLPAPGKLGIHDAGGARLMPSYLRPGI